MCVRLVAVPNMPRVGGTTVSFTPFARQNGRSVSSRFSLSSLQAITMRSTLPPSPPRRSSSMSQLSIRPVILAWMSGNSSSLRTTACARGPSPTMSDALRRSHAPPECPHAGAEDEGETEHRRPDEHPVVGAQIERGERREQQRQERGAAQRPDDEPRQLVHREVAQRAVVAVVQTGDLCRDDPDRHGKDEQERGGGAASPVADDHGSRRDRQHVGEREHAPQQRFGTVERRRGVGSEIFSRGGRTCCSADVELTQTGCLQCGNGGTHPYGAMTP